MFRSEIGSDDVIPVPNVNSKILSKVIEYCSFHAVADKKDEHGKPGKLDDEIKAFDTDFTKVDQGVLFELILVRRGWGQMAVPVLQLKGVGWKCSSTKRSRGVSWHAPSVPLMHGTECSGI